MKHIGPHRLLEYESASGWWNSFILTRFGVYYCVYMMSSSIAYTEKNPRIIYNKDGLAAVHNPVQKNWNQKATDAPLSYTVCSIKRLIVHQEYVSLVVCLSVGEQTKNTEIIARVGSLFQRLTARSMIHLSTYRHIQVSVGETKTDTNYAK